MGKVLVVLYKLFTAISVGIKGLVVNLLYNEYLRVFNARVAENIKFSGTCILQIKKGSRIEIGKNFRVNSGPRIGSDTLPASKITVLENAHLRIGDNSGIANTVLWCRDEIVIGDYVNIGTGTFIMDSNFHSIDWRIRMTPEDSKCIACAPIYIKDHAFIGARSIINKGVTIGEHSIVAAGSVVVKDVPDNEIWGGNPAKFIKHIDGCTSVH